MAEKRGEIEKIINHKRTEIEERQKLFPIELLNRSIFMQTPCISLTKYLQRNDMHGIIAEFKRKSPSKDAINLYANLHR